MGYFRAQPDPIGEDCVLRRQLLKTAGAADQKDEKASSKPPDLCASACPNMDPFSAWNLALLKTYFSPASAGDEVWLTVDPDELDAIAPELGGDKGFVEAVRAGPLWPTCKDGQLLVRGTSANLLERAEGLTRQRQNERHRPAGYVDPGVFASEYSGCDSPCYLPILAALVRNCARQDDRGYYPVLQIDLGLPPTWGSVQMSQLRAVWEDLESWSAKHKSRFGRFSYRRIGGLANVGVPRSQVIISRRDARALTRVFAQASVRAGQVPSDRILNDVIATAREVNFLSAAFAEALDRPEFSQPVRDRITTLLEDWDGVVFAPNREADSTDNEEAQRHLECDVALGLQQGNLLPWEVRWRIPALRDAGIAHLSFGHTQWTAEFAGTESVTSFRGDATQRAAASALLAASADEDKLLSVGMVGEESGPESVLRALLVPRRILRSFVPETDESGPAGQAILLERPLPATGHAYLLAAAGNSRRLEHFLQRNGIRHNTCPTDGLPDGWMLVHLPDCAPLTDALRDELPDGEPARSRPSVVRLVGGRAVQRGAGRQFLSFDLPIVELDAPTAVELQAPGLILTERLNSVPTTGVQGPVTALSSLRRFDIQVQSTNLAAFDIVAVHGGNTIGKVRLRLASDSGLSVSVGRDFAIDSRGHPQPEGIGLRGVLGSSMEIDHSVSSEPPPLHVHLGWPLHPQVVPELQSRAAVRFIDTLGRLGSIAFGQARDQLSRLSAPGDPNPYVVLRELRGRGFLEIETNSRGHWVRIHAVPPVLIVLPVTSNHGNVVAALGGTLRLRHWEELFGSPENTVKAFHDPNDPSLALPTIRVAASSVWELEQVATVLGCSIAENAADRIASWSSTIGDIESHIRRGGVESLGTGARHVERFIAPKGHFASSATGTSLQSNPSCELFQVEDADTGSHWIYLLGYRSETGQARYAFVRDPLWGIWIALAASAKWAKSAFGRDDLDPWPIHYSAIHHTLWLPKRLSLPVVLERALMLCSGATPIEEQVCRSPIKGALGLSRLSDGKDIGGVSVSYQDYVPAHPDCSQWLGYRWVPASVAHRVAEKIGAAVRPLVPVPTLMSS